MPRIRLTDKFVRSLSATPGTRREYLDAVVPQLMLRVGESGTKTWALLARYPGYRNPTRRSLGPVFSGRSLAHDPGIYDRDGAALTLGEAREKARRWLDMIARKIDPAEQQKQLARRAAEEAAALALAERSTFGMVAETWLKRHAVYLKKALEVERLVRREFLPRWEATPIAGITAKDIAGVIRGIVERNNGTTPTGRPRGTFQAFAAFGYLQQIFTFAIGAGEFEIAASPFAVLSQSAILGARTSRDRVLEDPELLKVWQAAEGLGYPFGDVVRLLILTGQRRREIANLNWGEIDLDRRLITIPARRMKTKRAHEVPLAPQALALLKSVPRWPAGGYVFSVSAGILPTRR